MVQATWPSRSAPLRASAKRLTTHVGRLDANERRNTKNMTNEWYWEGNVAKILEIKIYLVEETGAVKLVNP